MSNVPKLRFKEFSGEWEEQVFKELFERITTKNKENNLNVLTISAQQGLINQEEYFNKSVSSKDLTGYYLLNKNDFAYNKSYSKGYPLGAIKRLNRYEKGVVSTLYICFRAKKDSVDFIEQYFNSGLMNKEIHKIAQEGARNHGLLNISVTEFFNDTKLILPSKPEQEKIASFLTSIDTKIEQLTKKEELLQQYKKGVMQKIFNQEIRFKDNDGSDFREWEEKKLGDVGITYNGLTGKTSENFGSGKPYIQYKQIFDNSRITIDGFGYVSIEPNEKQNKVQFGDIFFTTSSETPNEVGFASVLLDDIEEVYLNSFCFGYRAKSLDILNPYFARFLFRSANFRREVIKLAQGSTRYNISKVELMKTIIFLPSIEEQTKIANFLSSIDSKIEQVQKQLNSTKEFKKALLQQMFV
ncbi:restriction endonuclease subunit S [Aliarcobacter cryaerophilus]|uniref:restriction endonuclease subunit S n=1 Tax=Aliarcobacter cryaerophilus TaxID=28198 RepID=UPI0021B6C9C7|nr:restriction endonuclease subunit S [Aliarcobacter cryaerophilus]MCT7535560.1 restriction endonuclease subunit S [Aliarcobacter cryaerophilus]